MSEPTTFIVRFYDVGKTCIGSARVVEYDSLNVSKLIQKRLKLEPNAIDDFILTSNGGIRISNVYSYEVIGTPDND